jgi:hypothetical protein
MVDAGIPNLELASLREEVSKLRKDIQDDRVERYARNLELMRVWMMVYTPIVSMMFLLFAFLGWRGLADIQTNKEKFEATAGKAAKLLDDVTAKFDAIKKEDEGFRGQIAENATIVQQNRTVLVGFKSDLNELERKHGELKVTEARLTSDLKGVSGQVQDLNSKLTATSNSFNASLSSSLSLTTGIGDVVSTSLNVPIITSVAVSFDGSMSIQGQGFGSSGKVVMSTMQPLSGVFSSTQPLPQTGGQFSSSLTAQIPVLVPSSYSSVDFPGVLTWSDTSILCGDVKKFFAENFHEDFDARKTIIGIQVRVESGTRVCSEWGQNPPTYTRFWVRQRPRRM